MTTDGEIRAKGGLNVNTTISDQQYDDWVLQAENKVNVFARNNWSDAVTAGLNADVKAIFSDIVSSLVAQQSIMFDMNSYSSRQEAEAMWTALRDGVQLNFSILRDKKVETIIQAA